MIDKSGHSHTTFSESDWSGWILKLHIHVHTYKIGECPRWVDTHVELTLYENWLDFIQFYM